VGDRLAETQQTLVLNDLRSRIWVQTDGQLKTGRDVVVAALLGADEVGFSTAPLIATGCIMMRACHLNTCPVGIATQDPELRKRFQGQPEHVVNFFFFVAEEARRLMAQLGVRTYAELIGHTELLEADDAIDHWKERGVDLTHVLAKPDVPEDTPLRRMQPQESPLVNALDWTLIEAAKEAIDHRRAVTGEFAVATSTGRSAACSRARSPRSTAPTAWPRDDPLQPARLGRAVLRRLAGARGRAHARRRRQRLHGQGPVGRRARGHAARGGHLPRRGERHRRQHGALRATAGRAFFRGLAGERFAVRNSGASAVVEGVGDHGCEYMTGGRAVILGPTGATSRRA
jgi:glutamate synthase (NADPH/NADH) large chain/glutamate synthase (ferredoxin)